MPGNAPESAKVTRLNPSARIYILLQVMTASAVVAWAWREGSPSVTWTFLVVLCLSAATGAMKIVLPKVQGTLSLSYVITIWGIVNMSLGETLLFAWVSTVAQSYWHCKKKPTALQLLFNLCTAAVSVGLASMAFRASLFRNLPPNSASRIFTVAVVYFLANTVSVSTVIGLTERLHFWNVWRTSSVPGGWWRTRADPDAPWPFIRADDGAVPRHETGFGECAERRDQAEAGGVENTLSAP
jgi:hypothetical protein